MHAPSAADVYGVPRTRPRDLGLIALAALNVVAYAVTLAVAGGTDGLLPIVSQLGLFLPGLLIVARASSPDEGWLPTVTIGPFVGIATTYPLLLLGWSLGARGAWLLLVAPLLASVLAIPAATLRGRWSLATLAPGDARALLAVLLIVPIVVARPFSLVGVEAPEGHLYRSYFTADYVWRRALVAELAKGDFLPRNPFYLDDVLHYYWLPHLPSAIDYRAWPGANLDSLLLARTVIVAAAFVAGVYGITRLLVASPLAAAIGVFAAFFLTSFEGTAALYVHWEKGAPLTLVRYLNIDAITRWIFGGMPMDGLHRILWYQPHHAMAYLMGFLGFVSIVRRRRTQDPAAFAVAGGLLGMSILFSSFAGLMYTAAAALYEALLTLRRQAWVAAIVNATAAALPLALCAAGVQLLGYVDVRTDNLGPLRFGLHLLTLHSPWTTTFLGMGPILLFATGGALYAWRRRIDGLGAWGVLIATTVYIYFFVDVRDHQEVYVGWRVGHVLFLAFAPLAGLCWLGLRELRGVARGAAIAVVVAATAAALPMPAIDMFNTQDVSNQRMGPGFRYTLVLSPEEWEGLMFLRDHTAADATVQVDAVSRNPDTWAYIPAFAERRMPVGLPISMVPLHKYEEGSKAAQWIYSAPGRDGRLRAGGARRRRLHRRGRSRAPGVPRRGSALRDDPRAAGAGVHQPRDEHLRRAAPGRQDAAPLAPAGGVGAPTAAGTPAPDRCRRRS